MSGPRLNMAGPKPKHPCPLIDALRERHGFPSDAALARAIGMSCATVSKVRSRDLRDVSAVMLAVHEALGVSFAEIRALYGREFSPGRRYADDRGDRIKRTRARHLFEAWCRKNAHDCDRDRDGESYRRAETQAMWRTWAAARGVKP